MTVVDPSAETAALPVPDKAKAGAGGAPQDETLEAPGGAAGTPSSAAPGMPGDVLEAGALLGKYRLERIVGAGGMGVVWAAVDPDLDRTVAIKVLRVAGDDPLLRSRLLREARAMARLKHGNVLTVYEVGTHKNRDYIAMELIEGASLDVWLAQKPPRPLIVAALQAAGRGLAAAHAAGIVHRDFKPHNVLRDQDGRVLVTDFGLARGQIEDPDDAELEQLDPASFAPPAAGDGTAGSGSQSRPRRALDSVLDSPLTQTGVLIGTPAYMAPEQFIGATPDPRTDQFAFCVAAWEALTGARPFRGGSLDELQQAAKRGVATVVADLPRDVRAVLQRGLEPDPARRWPDMTALLAALERAFNPPSRRGLWVGALVTAGVGALVAGVIMIATSRGAPSSPDGASPPTPVSAPRQVRILAEDHTGSGGDKKQVVIPLDQLRVPMPVEIPVPPVPPEPPAAPAAPGSRRASASVPATPGPPSASPGPGASSLPPSLTELFAEADGLPPELATIIEEAMKHGLKDELRAASQAARDKARASVDAARAAADEARAAAGEESLHQRCQPGEKVFASAWSPQRRKKLMASTEQSQALFGAVAILDGVRTEWLRSYAQICLHPEEPTFPERKACLLGMRDEVARRTKELDAVARSNDLTKLDVSSLAMVAASTALCVNDFEDGDQSPKPERHDKN